MNIYADRISQVRSLMRERGYDALVITGSDPHCSEYFSSRWCQVKYLSGFGGEAGDLVITEDHAGLWTDSRYFIAASQVLPEAGVALHKTRQVDSVMIPQWLSGKDFGEGKEGPIVIAVDGRSQSYGSVKAIDSAMKEAGREYEIVNVPDILDELWEGRPPIPQTPLITLGEDITGESRLQRLNFLRKFLLMNGYDAVLLTALDEVAWVLNVRGNDIPYNPLVISFLLVTMDEAYWFVQKEEIPPSDTESADSFDEVLEDGVQILPYADTGATIVDLMEGGEDGEGGIDKLFLDPSTLNYDLYCTLNEHVLPGSLVMGGSPVPLRKAVKNPVEIEGMREAHFEDGLAMEEFLYWLEKTVQSGQRVDEWDAACYLHSRRERIDGFRGESFETISAYGPSAALPHYVTPMEDAPVLEPRGLYLCDSGGQYLFGTTDITRTVPLGPCTYEEKEDYTLVLKGHIHLAMAVFPKGTAGCQLDVLAREALWKKNRNFGHGTGHGVGFYLCVHEGPQEFRQNFNPQPLLPGMITSDEPGIYREGLYGIRHESLLLCVDGGKNEFGQWYCFEPMTLCHIDTSPVLVELLTEEERRYLNEYNAGVYSKLSGSLPEEVRVWLKKKTERL